MLIFVNCFWKSVSWIRLISEAPQAATMFMDAAKRYRVDSEKLQKTVAKELATKREKKTDKPKARRRPLESIYS